MKAFSKPEPRDDTFPNEDGDETGEEIFGLAGESQCGQWDAKKGAVTSARCPPGSSETGSDLHGTCSGKRGTGRCLDSTGLNNAPTVSAAHAGLGHLEKELEEDDASSDIDVVRSGDGAGCSLSGMVAALVEGMAATPEELSAAAIGKMEEDAVADADWLDVTDALLDGAS